MVGTVIGGEVNCHTDHTFLWTIYDTLVEWDYDTLKPKPGMAEWSYANPTTMLLTLKHRFKPSGERERRFAGACSTAERDDAVRARGLVLRGRFARGVQGTDVGCGHRWMVTTNNPRAANKGCGHRLAAAAPASGAKPPMARQRSVAIR